MSEHVVGRQSPATRMAGTVRRGVVSRVAGKIVKRAAQAAWKYRE